MSTKEEIMKLADDYADAAATVILSTNTFGRDSAMANSRADDRTKSRDSLLKAVESLAADAARYRHIKKTIQVGAVRTMLPLYRVHHWHGYEAVSDYEQLDDALDAARKETP